MREIDKKNILRIFDILMLEYSWTIEYCLTIPLDVVHELYSIIQERKKVRLKELGIVIAAGSNYGFSGKSKALDNLFKEKQEEINPEMHIEHMRSLWKKVHPNKDIKIFGEQVKKGNVEF